MGRDVLLFIQPPDLDFATFLYTTFWGRFEVVDRFPLPVSPSL